MKGSQETDGPRLTPEEYCRLSEGYMQGAAHLSLADIVGLLRGLTLRTFREELRQSTPSSRTAPDDELFKCYRLLRESWIDQFPLALSGVDGRVGTA